MPQSIHANEARHCSMQEDDHKAFAGSHVCAQAHLFRVFLKIQKWQPECNQRLVCAAKMAFKLFDDRPAQVSDELRQAYALSISGVPHFIVDGQ